MKSSIPCLLACLLFSSGFAASADTFAHPGGAWRVTPPPAWAVRSAVDPRGYAVHIITPEKGDDLERIRKGIWVFAVPIPTGESLEGTSLSSLVSNLLISVEPDLKVSGSDVKAAIGDLPATAMDVTGRRALAGPWRGRLLVAIQDEQFVVVMYGAAPADWDEIRPAAERALATFEGAQRPPPRAEPAKPAQPERLSDVADRLRPSVPLIHILVKDAKQADAKFQPGGSGSGFIITEDGYLVTNRHVVNREDGELARESFDPVSVDWDVTLKRPSRLADVVAISYREDLALLKIRAAPGERFPAIPLADSRRARQGDAVAVLGWPNPAALDESNLNINQGTLTAVEHDARGRTTAMRHSARTTGGNSGGPLYDLELGGVIAAHNLSISTRRNGINETLVYKGVPADWIVREFPQVAAAAPRERLVGPARHALVAYYFMQERFGAATIEAKEALRDNPRDGVAAAYLARMYALLGAPRRAAEYAKLALGDPASERLACILGARTAIEFDDFKSAVDLATRAAQAAPNDADPHVLLGHAYAGMCRFDQARAEFNAALSISADLNPEAHGALGAMTINEWLVKNEVIQLPPKVAPPAELLARARASLNKSLELWPARNSLCHAMLGLASALEGKDADVVRRLNLCLRIGEKDPDSLLCAAFVLLLEGKFDQASGWVNQAKEMRDTPHAIFLGGWAKLQYAYALAQTGKNADAAQFANAGAMEYLVAAKLAPDAGWAPAALKVGRALYKPR